MTLYLKSNVHAVAIGDDLALLDLSTDAYLCLPDGAGVLPNGSRAAVAAGPEADTLQAAGLLSPTQPPPGCATPPLPTRTCIHLPASHPLGPRVLAAALGVVGDIRKARTQEGLGGYLGLADSSRLLSRDADAVAAVARLFWTMAPWLPIEGECLARSAMLVAFLRRMGLAADWVFGVRLWPFAAHCWVQSGDLCLNDDVERLWAYTPLYRR